MNFLRRSNAVVVPYPQAIVVDSSDVILRSEASGVDAYFVDNYAQYILDHLESESVKIIISSLKLAADQDPLFLAYFARLVPNPDMEERTRYVSEFVGYNIRTQARWHSAVRALRYELWYQGHLNGTLEAPDNSTVYDQLYFWELYGLPMALISSNGDRATSVRWCISQTIPTTGNLVFTDVFDEEDIGLFTRARTFTNIAQHRLRVPADSILLVTRSIEVARAAREAEYRVVILPDLDSGLFPDEVDGLITARSIGVIEFTNRVQ